MIVAEIVESVIVDGVRLEVGGYVPEDARATVVLLHGIPSIAPPQEGDEGYAGWARRFAEAGFIAVYADMRAARDAPGYFSIGGWVRDARAVIDQARSLEAARELPVSVVGSSAGGVVACEAIKNGARVDALALLATPAAWLSFAADPVAGVRRISEEAGMAIDPSAIDDPTQWAAEFDIVTAESAISSVECPVLIVHGTADDVVPVDHAQRLAARCAHADVHIVEGAGHQLRRNDAVVNMVVEWLRATVA